MSGYMRCGKCRLYIDRTGTSRFTRVCQCAGTLEVSVRAHIRAFVRFDKRPLWQRALERRRREKLWTVPDWYVDPTNATSLARDEPGLKVSLGDLCEREPSLAASGQVQAFVALLGADTFDKSLAISS